MGWFKKKPDPISERARALSQQIASLEAQIKQLDSKITESPPEQPVQTAPPVSPGPRVRSTALPHNATPPPPAPQPIAEAPPAAAVPKEPIFEDVDQKRLQAHPEPASTPEHFNDLGVRKYDFAALVQRIRNHFQGPSTANPKLVNYLAAGSVHGLRPMRYEKRVARNRFLFFVALLLLVLVGIIARLARW